MCRPADGSVYCVLENLLEVHKFVVHGRIVARISSPSGLGYTTLVQYASAWAVNMFHMKVIRISLRLWPGRDIMLMH